MLIARAFNALYGTVWFLPFLSALYDVFIFKYTGSDCFFCFLTQTDLKMTIRGEMEYAYQGEILTPSQCGRMDQGCAFGSRPIVMTYDGEHLDVDELHMVGGPLHYLLVDLRGTKSTTIILQGLQEGYPEPKTVIHRGVHKLFGEINQSLIQRASAALQCADAPLLGQLMTEAQEEFDRYAQPACPSQLTMPLLHQVLAYGPIQDFVWGGKGVGSQGDGTVQLLCKGAVDRTRVAEILQRDFGMPSLELTLTSGASIDMAVIPAAGWGVQNFPATLPVRTELFPVIDVDGVAKPIILVNVESLVDAGIKEVLLIVQQADLPSFERLFKSELDVATLSRLPSSAREYARKIRKIGDCITFVVQDDQEGFGHAVYAVKDHVKHRPFLLLLGDHVYSSTAASGASCVQQMLDTYKHHQANIVGLKKTSIAEVSRYGAVSGIFKRDDPAGKF